MAAQLMHETPLSVSERQATLFEVPPPVLEPAPPEPGLSELAARLPRSIRLGTMSWSFPGWRGLVYAKEAPLGALSALGLGAYSKHPLLGAVEIDRSYYEPLDVEVLRSGARRRFESTGSRNASNCTPAKVEGSE
jgi:hypothetical protein